MTALTNRAARGSGRTLDGSEHRSQNPIAELATLNSVKEHGSHGAVRSQLSTESSVALLTGGGDKPYALGLAEALTSAGLSIDFIGSDDLDVPVIVTNPRVKFLNLRGDQSPDTSVVAKASRILRYYARLIHYAAVGEPKVLHILWNNKFQLFDRTLLMLYYRLLGKKLVFTAHNVNAGKRDSNDSYLNRLSLKIQYGLSDHIFVHTDQMKKEFATEFGVSPEKVAVIPFGINNTVPNTALTSVEAKRELGLNDEDRALLFFGNIAPYKGLEYLVAAFFELAKTDEHYRLLIVGKPKGDEDYWKRIEQTIAGSGLCDRVVAKIEYVPDEATELYFKAADVLILPYTRIFQSGVLFLGYSFGLPALAADVGTLKEEIVEGETGLVFRSQDSPNLAEKITRYFESDLYRNLDTRRQDIKEYANERYSWNKVAAKTTAVYSDLLKN